MTTLRLIYVFSTLLLITLILNISDANAEEGHHTLGVQAGEVGLSGDVGNIYGNALGGGLFFDYAASDYLELELSWLTSHHTGSNSGVFGSPPLSLTQNSYMVALQYNIDTLDIFTPYLKGGAEFINHGQDVINPQTLANSPANTTGFGLDIGVGSKVDVGSHLMAGLDLLYHSIFTTTYTPPNSPASVNTIQSYFTVMLRLGYSFGETGYHTGGAKPPGH